MSLFLRYSGKNKIVCEKNRSPVASAWEWEQGLTAKAHEEIRGADGTDLHLDHSESYMTMYLSKLISYLSTLVHLTKRKLYHKQINSHCFRSLNFLHRISKSLKIL